MLEIIWGLEQKLIFLFHMNQNGAMSGYHDFRMSACQKRLNSTHNRGSSSIDFSSCRFRRQCLNVPPISHEYLLSNLWVHELISMDVQGYEV